MGAEEVAFWPKGLPRDPEAGGGAPPAPERLAFSMIDFEKDNLTAFSDAIIGIRDKICKCVECGNISDTEFCSICLNEKFRGVC